MKKIVKILGIFLFLLFVGFSAEAKDKEKSVRTNSGTWVPEKTRKIQMKNWRIGKPNSNKSNFSWRERTRAHGKTVAKKAKKNCDGAWVNEVVKNNRRK